MKLVASEITAAGRRVSIVRSSDSRGGEPMLLVHGGRAGVTPIACGAHLWNRALPYLAAGRPVIALDLPGTGCSELGSPDVLTVEMLGRHLLAVMDVLSLGRVHLIGHDIGGLIGFWLAISAPVRLRTLSLAGSGVAAPTGDSLNDILFDAVPVPLWTRTSQIWAIERLSYAHGHIDDDLIAACVAAGGGRPHAEAVEAMRDEKVRVRDFGIGAVKGKIWQALRSGGMSVPTQLVWSSHDPLASREAGYVLFKIIGEKQRATQFHLINRAGSFSFREQPEEFARVVVAFQDGIELETAAYAEPA